MRQGQMVRMLGIVMLCWGLSMGKAQAFSASYTQKVTHKGQTFLSHVMMQEAFFRIEATIEGQTSVIIHNADGVFTYLPQQQMAMKMPALDPSQQPMPGLENYQHYLQDQHAELRGTETIGGRLCDVYHFTELVGKGETTVWVWKEKQFPLRAEIHDKDGITLVEMTDIRVGATPDPAAFQVPAGVQVMDIGAGM